MENSEIKKNVKDLSFSHNRDSVDVHVWDSEGDELTRLKNVSADAFLNFFDYGTCVSDDKELNVSFLDYIL